MLNRRDELACCLGPDNKIYAIGGYGGSANASCLSTVERYDPLSNKWELVAPMNEGRRALAAVAMPDGIYAIGGYNGKDYIDSVERYDLMTNRWSLVTKLTSPKCTMSALAAPDFQSIYVLGGFNGVQLNEIEKYDLNLQEFVPFGPSMSQKRFMHSSVMILH
jgi:N-acetylneuraminic acid mutarotase